jgi:hypothetical protein
VNSTHNLKRIVAGALLSAGVAVAGLGLAASPAQAHPGVLGPLSDGGPWTWCPGDSMSEGLHPDTGRGAPGVSVDWDMTRCHTWYGTNWGMGNIAPYIWDGDNPPPEAITPRPCPPIAFMCP